MLSKVAVVLAWRMERSEEEVETNGLENSERGTARTLGAFAKASLWQPGFAVGKSKGTMGQVLQSVPVSKV